MVPEVLLALMGVPGEVIVLEPASASSPERFRVSPDLPFVDAPERACLDRLVSLGYAFRCLEAFATREGSTSGADLATGRPLSGAPPPVERRAAPPSLYRRALAAGVGEVLATYESAILRLEQDVLRGVVPALPAALESALAEFAVVLPALHETLAPVMASPATLRGAALMHHLHAAARDAGAPRVEAALVRLRGRCAFAAYQQTLAWCVHGVLADPAAEFWVVPVEGAGGEGGVWLGADDRRRGDETFLFGEEDARDAKRSFRADAETTLEEYAYFAGDAADADAHPEEDGGEGEWHRGFQVSLEALPPGVELPAAEATLFVGRAVRVLSRPRGAYYFGRATPLLPASHARRATRLIRDLADAAPSSDGAFDRARFEAAIREIERPIASALGKLVIEDAGLTAHLDALRGYLLMGRGDFYQQFFEEAGGLLARPPRPATAERELEARFQRAAMKSSAEHDPLAARFRPRFDPARDATGATSASSPSSSSDARAASASFRVPSLDGWDALELEYRVPWPLGLVVTRDAIARYNRMFQYAFRLRRVLAALDEAWLELRRRGDDEHRRRLAACQSFARFLLNNLLTYLQVDVIEASHAEMLARIRAAPEDVSNAQRALRACLARVAAQSFLDLERVSDVVERVMALATRLARLVAAGRDDAADLDAVAEKEREAGEIAAAHERVAAELWRTLRSERLADDPKAPHLRQLLLRLNFNDFFSADEDARRRDRAGDERANPGKPGGVGGGSATSTPAGGGEKSPRRAARGGEPTPRNQAPPALAFRR